MSKGAKWLLIIIALAIFGPVLLVLGLVSVLMAGGLIAWIPSVIFILAAVVIGAGLVKVSEPWRWVATAGLGSLGILGIINLLGVA
jgi:hypothetical protein